MLDTLASAGPVPVGFFVASETLGREVNATQFFFNVGDGVDGAAANIEAAFFQNGVETINVKESIAEAQAAQKTLFNLLIGFMSLGLLVGIAALGVIGARAVVGIGLGFGLGLISSVELIDEMRVDEPEVEFVIPWLKVILIALGAYIFSILITLLPARQAAKIAPAEALRYE